MANSKFVRVAELAAMLSVSKATCWRWVKLGLLPQPKRLGPGVTAWSMSDVQACLAAKDGK